MYDPFDCLNTSALPYGDLAPFPFAHVPPPALWFSRMAVPRAALTDKIQIWLAVCGFSFRTAEDDCDKVLIALPADPSSPSSPSSSCSYEQEGTVDAFAASLFPAAEKSPASDLVRDLSEPPWSEPPFSDHEDVQSTPSWVFDD